MFRMFGKDKISKILAFLEYQLLALALLLVIVVFVFEFISADSPDHVLWMLVVTIILIIISFVIRRTIDARVSSVLIRSALSSSEEFVSLYERSPAPYLTIDQKGQINMFNQATILLLKTNTDSVGDINFFDLLVEDEDDEGGARMSVLLGKIKTGVTLAEEEVRIRIMNGDVRYVVMSVYRYTDESQRLISLTDITDQKMVDTAKSEFVALATHQLRTPIAAIRWNLELLQKNITGEKAESQIKYADKIENNVTRMTALINDFLNVSKLEMGTFATNPEQINLSEFFDSVIEEFTDKVENKHLTVNRKEEPLNFNLRTDSRLLHIIVSNLVSNSVKYARENGSISLEYEVVGTKLVIKVADDGIGIPKSEIDNLFSKFYRASNAESHHTEGTGLGLYIVKQSAEQLGGGVSVMSEEDQGATFTVELPIR